MKSTFEIISKIAENVGLSEDYSFDYAHILGGIFNTGNHSDGLLEDPEEVVGYLEEIAYKFADDFLFEFDGNEYRIIRDSEIWEIYVQEIQNIVEECYSDVLKLDKIPAFISVSVDWEATAHNAYADGYGHTFASYDGEEHQSDNGAWWVFRTN